MIIKNNTKRAFFFEGEAVLPGTNNVKKEWNREHPSIKALVEAGSLEIIDDDKLDADAAVKAVNEANTVKAVEEIAKKVADDKVKKAAKKRIAELKDAFKQIDEAVKKAQKDEDKEED